MKLTTRQMCQTAVFTAVVFVVTRFIQIPIPLGYFNVGNCIILASCVMLPAPCGIFAGAVGSALADLTSYPAYTIPTLIIKAVFPIVFYLMMKLPVKKTYGKAFLGAAVATLIPLFGYTAVGAFIAGNFASGLAQFPGLLAEYAANLALFAILMKPCLKLRSKA